MKIRDRIIELRRVKASELRPHPLNWRTHPTEQRSALRACFDEIGFAGVILVVDREGSLLICDGHLRASEAGDQIVPVLVLDLSDDEVQKLLAVYDPISGMAQVDPGKLDALLQEVETDSEALQALLDDLAEENGLSADSGDAVQITPVDTKPPPKMAWILIGIPLIRYGEVNGLVEQLAASDGVILETALNDGAKEPAPKPKRNGR